MVYTHINLTSQERTHENDDDVVVVFSFYYCENTDKFQKQKQILNFTSNYFQGSMAYHHLRNQ